MPTHSTSQQAQDYPVHNFEPGELLATGPGRELFHVHLRVSSVHRNEGSMVLWVSGFGEGVSRFTRAEPLEARPRSGEKNTWDVIRETDDGPEDVGLTLYLRNGQKTLR